VDARIVVSVGILLGLLIAGTAFLFADYRGRTKRHTRRIRAELLALLDDALYRSVKAWRKHLPNERHFHLGNGSSEADHLYRALCWLKMTSLDREKIVDLAGKIGHKFDAIVWLTEIS